MTILPWTPCPTCPKCGSDILVIKWHAEGTCPPPMAYYMHDDHTERIPKGDPEHLHGTCRCGFSLMMRTKDNRLCPKCHVGPEGHLCK